MQAQLERLRQRREEEEMGFTLIELLIVIVILGILAAIVVFAVQNLTQQSSNAACQSDYKTVEVGAEAYKAQMGAYPGATQNGVTDMLATATAPTSGQTVGPWLKDSPNSSKYSVTVGTNNISIAGAKTAAVAAFGAGTTPALQTPDGVIWMGTPAATPTLYTSGSGATLTNNAGTWTAAGQIYAYNPGPHATSTITGELTGTAQGACAGV